MAFEPKDALEHRDELTADFVTQTKVVNLRENGLMFHIFAALGVKLEEADYAIHQLRDLANLDRLTGEDLDEYAAAVLPDGQTRDLETFAVAPQVFVRVDSTGATVIPKGTQVAMTTDSAVYLYETTAQVTIADGFTISAAVPVSAVLPGSASSAPSKAINKLVTEIDKITETYNVTPAEAVDEESDDELRERLRGHTRSLAKSTPPAIEGMVRQVKDDNGRRIRAAWSLPDIDLPGVGYVYVDDGFGTVSEFEAVSGSTLIASAIGGERLIYTQQKPWKSAPVVMVDGAPLVAGVDYTTVWPWGQIRLKVALTAGEVVTVGDFSVYTGLIAEAQRRVDGDPDDRIATPGYRAAFATAQVLPATVQWLNVSGSLVVDQGYDKATVEQAAADASVLYVNSLNVGDTWYWSRAVERIMAVPGAVKVTLDGSDVYVLPNVVLRTSDDLVDIA